MALKHRLISGILLVSGMVLASYYLPSIMLWAILVAVCGLAGAEFHAMLSAGNLPSFRYLALAAGAVLVSATFFSLVGPVSHWLTARGLQGELETLALLAIILSVMIRQFPQKYNSQPIVTVACTLLGVLYVPYLYNFFTKLGFGWEQVSLWTPMSRTGRLMVFYLVVVVKSVDTGAFLIGSACGRHKLFPRVSPSKTWEGVMGGLAGGIAASLIFFLIAVDGSLSSAPFGVVTVHLHDAVALGFILAAAAVVGDLAESLIKRAVGAKDSGHSLPGLGGLMDVLDSLLFAAPILYLYARFFMQ